MADTKFVLHQTNLTADEEVYLTGDNSTIEDGFKPGTPALSSAVNAILHETSLFVTAFDDLIGYRIGDAYRFTPSADVSTASDKLHDFLIDAITNTQVNVAGRVLNSYAITFNGQDKSFNGSIPVSFTFYAPITSGSTNNQLLVSVANGAPVWSTANIGGLTAPVYLASGVLTQCATYAGATSITLNNVSKAGTTASIWAPTSNGTANYVLIANGGTSAPTWTAQSSLSVGNATKVTNQLTIDLNDTFYRYDGSTIKTVSFYAPTTIGSDNQLLMSTGSGAPSWYDSPFYIKSELDSGYVFRKRKLIQRVNIANQTIASNQSASSDVDRVIFSNANEMQYESDTAIYREYITDEIADASKSDTTVYRPIEYKWQRWVTMYDGSSYGAYGGDMMRLTLVNRTRTNAGQGKLWVDAGGIETSGSVTATTFSATSDARLKTNIKDYVPSKSILDLPVKEFDFKQTGTHHIGCLAQDLMQIAPELVHADAEGFLQIEESKLVYLLLDEVRKLRKEIDDIKKGK